MGNQWAVSRGGVGSAMAGSKDIAKVLLSPRFSGAESPRNRFFSSSSRRSDSFADFVCCRARMDKVVPANADGGAYSEVLSDECESGSRRKRPARLLEMLLYTVLVNFLSSNVVLRVKKIGAKRFLRQLVLYVVLVLMMGLFLMKLSSVL